MRVWVDFGMVKQNMGIEQVLGSYGVELKRVGHHQLRGLCPLPTHGSERSRESFSVDTAKNVWACHSASCCKLRQGRVGGAAEPATTTNWLQKKFGRVAHFPCRH